MIAFQNAFKVSIHLTVGLVSPGTAEVSSIAILMDCGLLSTGSARKTALAGWWGGEVGEESRSSSNWAAVQGSEPSACFKAKIFFSWTWDPGDTCPASRKFYFISILYASKTNFNLSRINSAGIYISQVMCSFYFLYRIILCLKHLHILSLTWGGTVEKVNLLIPHLWQSGLWNVQIWLRT